MRQQVTVCLYHLLFADEGGLIGIAFGSKELLQLVKGFEFGWLQIKDGLIVAVGREGMQILLGYGPVCVGPEFILKEVAMTPALLGFVLSKSGWRAMYSRSAAANSSKADTNSTTV